MEKNDSVQEESNLDLCKTKPKGRGKKRKRKGSNSSTGSESDVLPENALEVEKNLIASAAKNNLDDVSVKKILKKVVTNDHVLALVKLREEEESSSMEQSGVRPKLTRAKVKELMKVSPQTAPWNLENIELTPIKHIPVKTRPEVKALIAQELPEDEDDEEYRPTQDEVLSDDDQGLESCSDLESQPRTPATPSNQQSPMVVKDGPFKVPQGTATPTRRKLDLEEEATIALRTRSKLSLSETPIEHIESSFVPPDDIPVPPENDQLWSEFLTECLNPASVSRNEDDDETDPEYNVAADPDAHEEDEEALEGSIVKISKKELNDLMTELFSIMPVGAVEEELTHMADRVLTDTNTPNETSKRWEGKQEPASDDESPKPRRISERLVFERRSSTTTTIQLSVGKTEPVDVCDEEPEKETDVESKKETDKTVNNKRASNVVDISMEECVYHVQPAAGAEGEGGGGAGPAPALLRTLRPHSSRHRVRVTLDEAIPILPEQIQILQQQLRQHIQIATSNFLQLCVNPLHWSLAPTYKEYLQTLVKMVDDNPSSVVDVCNLKPALELVQTWEKTVSEDTPENAEMVQFIQNEAERWRRRHASNCPYVGEFHETLKRVVANSPVFLYPYLLPPMPFRADACRRFSYLRAEDELIALGLDQFWEYLDNNPQLYRKPNRKMANRWGLTRVIELVVKHMLPWHSPRTLLQHVKAVRRLGDRDNPICKFFITGKAESVKHKIKPFNPTLTLYEQPEHEMPRLWLRYLAKTSKRFKTYLFRRPNVIGQEPNGVEIDLGLPKEIPVKPPLPINLDKKCRRKPNLEPKIKPIISDKVDVTIDKAETTSEPINFYELVETSNGSRLVPLIVSNETLNNIKLNPETNTVDCNVTPITSCVEFKNKTELNKQQINKETDTIIEQLDNSKHCKCCLILRRICKTRQTFITDFFSSKKDKRTCYCNEVRHPRISNKLRLLVDRYKTHKENVLKGLERRMGQLGGDNPENIRLNDTSCTSHADDLAFAIAFKLKLTHRCAISKNKQLKRRLSALLTNFDPDWDDPLSLAAQFDKICEVELVDVYKEFITFLTPEQADKIDRFKDYFTQNCVEPLVKKIEEQVSDNDTKYCLLVVLREWFAGGDLAPCQMCSDLLSYMGQYPGLARFTFSLFPHVKAKLTEDTTTENKTEKKEPEPCIPQKAQPVTEEDKNDDTLVNVEESNAIEDYEADHSSCGSGDEDSDTESVVEQQVLGPKIKSEKSGVLVIDGSGWIVDTHLTVSKTETEEYSESSDMSMMIMSEDEIIKSEPSEWKRDEDKLILEVLKQHLTPEERKEKTIQEILEEKDVLQIIYESLESKTKDDVRERVLYLLKVLLMGES